jgi:hypothetical protein
LIFYKKKKLFQDIKNRAGSIAQAVEYLLCKVKALSSKPHNGKKKDIIKEA